MGTVVIDEFFLSERPYVANPKPSVAANSGPAISDEGLLDLSEAQAAMFFYDHVVGPGYVKDSDYKDFASIASTGFGLTALTILAKRYDAGSANWNQVTPAQAQARAEAVMDDILRVQGLQASAPTQYGNQGFLFHFINGDGTRYSYSEVSVVDHALLVAGVLTAGEYFGGNLKTKAEQIYMNTNWKFFLNTANHLFYRAWAPGGGLQGAYDSYTDEILLISLLAIGTDPTDEDLLKTFYSFPRTKRSYTSPGGETFTLVNSFFGSAFTYLYAHGWFDFEKLGNDKPELTPGMGSVESVNWWTNSVQGIRSNRQFCIDRSAYFPFSFHSQSWGLSAVERPDYSYEGRYGAPPFNLGAHDGTVAVYVPLSSMPLLRTMAEESVSDNQGFQVLKFYYSNYYQNLFGQYGAADSLDNEGGFSGTFLGIDKGLEAIMIENYRTRFIWDTLKKNARIKAATEKIFGAAPSDEDSFSAVLKNVSDDQLAEKLSFGQNIMGAGYVSSGQYIEIQYNLTSPTVGVHVFTNNTDYEGDAEGAGFVGQTDKKESVSMFWTAFDGIQAGGYLFSGDDDHEAVIQDRRRTDFLSPDTVKNRLIVDGNNTLMPSKSGKGQGGTPVYVYLGTNFQNASAQLYKAAVVVEICHFS